MMPLVTLYSLCFLLPCCTFPVTSSVSCHISLFNTSTFHTILLANSVSIAHAPPVAFLRSVLFCNKRPWNYLCNYFAAHFNRMNANCRPRTIEQYWFSCCMCLGVDPRATHMLQLLYKHQIPLSSPDPSGSGFFPPDTVLGFSPLHLKRKSVVKIRHRN